MEALGHRGQDVVTGPVAVARVHGTETIDVDHEDADASPPGTVEGGLEALLANIDKVKSMRNREKLTAAREQILQNRKMVELDCQMELPVPIDDLRIKPDYPALIAQLEKCEFKSLLQEVKDEAAKAGASTQTEMML